MNTIPNAHSAPLLHRSSVTSMGSSTAMESAPPPLPKRNVKSMNIHEMNFMSSSADSGVSATTASSRSTAETRTSYTSTNDHNTTSSNSSNSTNLNGNDNGSSNNNSNRVSNNVSGRHVDSYIKEVRRKTDKEPMKPKIEDFQIEDEKTKKMSTKWMRFLEAWIRYIIAIAADEETAERPLDPLSINVVKSDFNRLYSLMQPFIEPAKKIQTIYRWENKILTASIASLYMVLCYYGLFLASACAGMAISIAWIRFSMFAEYGVETLQEQPETDATVKSWNRSLWMKMRTTVVASYKNVNSLQDKSSSVTDMYAKYGPLTQQILNDTVDYLERIKNLFTWKRPGKARILFISIASSSVLLTFIPAGIIVKSVFFYIGFEFFVLQALRSHYPRHRRLFNLLNLVLWDVPNDAEYAREVLCHSPQPKAHQDIVTNDPPRPMSTRISVSMSDISTTTETPQTIVRDNSSIENRAKGKEGSSSKSIMTSTAANLAMLATAAAVNKIKKTVEQRSDKKKKATEELIQDNGESDAFGCMYKGTIPGKIILHEDGFIFQTSRMTGAKVFVECAFDDILGIKKTAQINMLVLNSTGIDIATSEGDLHFENVLRRDECFGLLVTASGGQGDNWKRL